MRQPLTTAGRWIAARARAVANVARALWHVAADLGRVAWRVGRAYRAVLIPAVAIIVALAVLAALVLVQSADSDSKAAIVARGYHDDQCFRAFNQRVNDTRTDLNDALAAVATEGFHTTKALSEGLIAALLADDEQATLQAIARVRASGIAGDDDVKAVGLRRRQADAANAQVRQLTRYQVKDRDAFEAMCERGPTR